MAKRPLPDFATALTCLAEPDASGVSDSELLRRFADARDEAAFELLVWRHGGMVLGTCRRVLGRSADADDAFQATFLALARKAGAVRRGESLPGWLHRVALRAALRLRAAGQHTLAEAIPLTEVAAPAEPLPDDTAAVLDEEIGRLPHKLRVAFVLCALEERTDSEAAELLGCPKGTVLSRLARARERLRLRLTRRGKGLGPGSGVLPGRSMACDDRTRMGRRPQGLPAVHLQNRCHPLGHRDWHPKSPRSGPRRSRVRLLVGVHPQRAVSRRRGWLRFSAQGQPTAGPRPHRPTLFPEV